MEIMQIISNIQLKTMRDIQDIKRRNSFIMNMNMTTLSQSTRILIMILSKEKSPE